MTTIPGRGTELSPAQKRSLLIDLMDDGESEIRLYPLSLAQQRLWFLEQLEPGTATHNISSGLRLKGDLDTQALRRSIGSIVARHETLRTAFVTLQGEVFQKVSRTGDVEIPAKRTGSHARKRTGRSISTRVLCFA
jgi:hypothetical protein